MWMLKVSGLPIISLKRLNAWQKVVMGSCWRLRELIVASKYGLFQVGHSFWLYRVTRIVKHAIYIGLKTQAKRLYLTKIPYIDVDSHVDYYQLGSMA